MEPLAGNTIGGFRLSRPIGSGCTGQVFEAQAGVANRAAAAIKILHPALCLYTKVESFWQELQEIRRLSMQYIVTPQHADWSKSGRFYMVTELLGGADLHQVLSSVGRLPARQALLIAGHVCLALEAAHQAGLVHGALKPHNVQLVRTGAPGAPISTRLLDLATLHLVDTIKVPSGSPGSPGVPEAAYLAPEQFRSGAVPASDIYALGVLLYEMLTGRRPFAGSYHELASQHATAPPPPSPRLPDALGRILLKALAKSPDGRYPDVASLREALEGWAASSPPELEEPAVELLAKDGAASGVAQEEDPQEPTVRIAMTTLSDQDNEPGESEVQLEEAEQMAAQDKRPPAQEQKQKSASSSSDESSSGDGRVEDQELAAIAEQAAAPLRSKERPSPTAAAGPREQAEPQREVEGYFDEDGDLVELPLERSVRAFVSRISPTIPTPAPIQPGTGNGESLEGALDSFIREARAWSSALPPPAIDDSSLAELVRGPLAEPAPPAPEPVQQPEATRATATLPAIPPPQRSLLTPILIAFAVGGLAVFGITRLLAPVGSGTPATPDLAGEMAGSSVTPVSAPEVTPLPDVAPLPGSEPAAAAAAGAAIGGDAGPAAAAPGETSPAGGSPTAAGGTAEGAAGEGRPAAKAAPASKRPRVSRPPRPAGREIATKKADRPAAKKPEKTEKPEKASKKGGGSDWVDPFSQ